MRDLNESFASSHYLEKKRRRCGGSGGGADVALRNPRNVFAFLAPASKISCHAFHADTVCARVLAYARNIQRRILWLILILVIPITGKHVGVNTNEAKKPHLLLVYKTSLRLPVSLACTSRASAGK